MEYLNYHLNFFLLLALYKYICLILCIYFINLILKSHQQLNFL